MLRTQHWERQECVYNPIVGPGTEEVCGDEPKQEDVEFGQKRTPLKMQEGAPDLEWQAVSDSGIEVTLLDDDFSNAIDGSGYIQNIDYRFTPEEA